MPEKSAPKKSVKTTAKKVSKKTGSKDAVKKKATKKVSSKKSGSKKVSNTKKSKKTDAKVLICANEKECFWTTDGKVLADLKQLEAALNEMADEVFSYHVNKERNDFADWVETVLNDADCASDLRRAKKPGTARTVVVRHLKLYA